MNNLVYNIVVSGVGGQGTVLAAKLLAQCALNSGAFVRSAETIGMAQRGGSVLGHVRINASGSSDTPASPLVQRGQAHVLIGFEPAETLRACSFCNAESLVVTATQPLSPPTASLERIAYDGTSQLAALEQRLNRAAIARLVVVDNKKVCAELGFEKALNVVLLGAALKALAERALDSEGAEGTRTYGARAVLTALDYAAMQRTIEQTVKQRFVETNLRALELGYNGS